MKVMLVAAFGKIRCLERRQLKKLLAAALDKNMSASALNKKLCLEQRYIKSMLGAAPKKTAGSCVRQNLNLFAFEQTRSP